MSPRQRLWWNASAQMLLVVLIVLFANLLAADHVLRLDLTTDRLHSLDEASKAIVAGLDRPLVVRAYVSGGLEAPYNNHEQAIRDKVEEFAVYSRGRMRVKVVDPADDPALLEEARSYGLTPLEYTVRTADRAELRKVWMGAVVLYGDRTEVLPTLTRLGSLEYDLAAAIDRASTKAEDIPILAWSVGHGEPDPTRAEGPLRAMIEAIGKKFVIAPVELGGPGLLDDKIDALVVIGPSSPLPDRALWQIDQFLMKGKGAAIFVTNNRPDLRAMRPVRVGSGLDPLLGHYGVELRRDIVLDRVANGAMRMPVREGDRMGSREVNTPLIPKATELSRRSPLTSGLDGMLFPFASSLGVASPLPEGVSAEVLARSADTAGAVQSLKTMDPEALVNVLSSEKRGPFDLLVALTGAWRSFFETRATPPPDPAVPEEQDGLVAESAPVVEGAPARLVVAGSADFVLNNPTFMLNVVDWLVQDEALIGIRSKLASVASLRPTGSGERAGWRAFNLLTAPILLALVWATRSLRLRERR